MSRFFAVCINSSPSRNMATLCQYVVPSKYEMKMARMHVSLFARADGRSESDCEFQYWRTKRLQSGGTLVGACETAIVRRLFSVGMRPAPEILFSNPEPASLEREA